MNGLSLERFLLDGMKRKKLESFLCKIGFDLIINIPRYVNNINVKEIINRTLVIVCKRADADHLIGVAQVGVIRIGAIAA